MLFVPDQNIYENLNYKKFWTLIQAKIQRNLTSI